MIIEPTIIREAKSAIAAAGDETSLQQLRVKYLGRKGVITEALKGIKDLPASKRAKAGAEANAARQELETAINAAQKRLAEKAIEQEAQQVIDLTAPSQVKLGHIHPVTQLLDELVQIFWQMGFTIAEGPEVETEWYNFEALNIPPDHPARDMQDTFYLEGGNLPRTHTSGVQIRYMQEHEPPIRIIAPGKVYRNEDEDPRHSWMFYQVEGLVVDKGISLADLKGTLLAMMQGLLGPDANVRLRPNYFPYTEPSVEMDGSCFKCGGKGGDCELCSGTGWVELGGAGMVHPEVLRRVGLDPEIYSGFAFGFGPERIALLKYGLDDIRYLWRPNLKFLEQF